MGVQRYSWGTIGDVANAANVSYDNAISGSPATNVQSAIDNTYSDLDGTAKRTENDITLYVSTTGNDSNDGLTAGASLLTIQAAIDKIPKLIEHTVVIDIGAGTFTSLYVSGVTIADGSFTIQGTLGTPSVDGKTEGTATGGSTTQLVDAAGGWTVDQLIGKLVLVAGEYRVPYDNDGTTIYFQRPFSATCNGKAYEIVEQKTVLTGTEPMLEYGPIAITNNHVNAFYNLYIHNIKATGATVGFYCNACQGVTIERCYNSGSHYGYFSQEAGGYLKWYHNYSTSNGGAGFAGSRDGVRDRVEGNVANDSGSAFYFGLMTGLLECKYNVAINSVTGLWLEGCWYIDCGHNRFTDNSGYGIQSYYGKSASDSVGSSGRLNIYGGQTNISDNVLGGVSVGLGTFLFAHLLVGTGNGGFGLEVFSGAYALISSAVSITGSSGDATINDGATTLAWATDFAADGDIVVNTDNGCRIERSD